MFIQLKNEKINVDFNTGIYLKVDGPDDYYYAQVSEYLPGEETPKYVEGYEMSDLKNPLKNYFSLPIEFYIDFELTLFKFVDKIGLVKIFSHRYNDYDQYVRFVLKTHNLKECQIWVNKVEEYQTKTGCKIIMDSEFPEINRKYHSYYSNKEIQPYKTYKLGRFPKTSTDFRTLDERCEGLIWFGYWKKFWSYQHPHFWKGLSSEEIANDILGL